MKKPLVIIAGPTASGKTKLSVMLAKRINGEIISADSMQAYKYMDIGSAKITKEEMDGIRHYGIDILLPNEELNVVKFQKMANEALDEIYKRGKIPILVGGTGFYIQAVLYAIEFSENNEDKAYRNELEKMHRNGVNLHEMLKEIDHASYEKIDPNNTKRIIRALEYYKQTGEPISIHNEREKCKESPYNYSFFVLSDDREKLYERIDRRVDKMLADGLVEEVKHLKSMGLEKDAVSMQGLGYKEILDYLNGIISLEEAIYIIKRDTRHFAKRQITWFKRERGTTFVDINNNPLEIMINELKEKIIYNE